VIRNPCLFRGEEMSPRGDQSLSKHTFGWLTVPRFGCADRTRNAIALGMQQVAGPHQLQPLVGLTAHFGVFPLLPRCATLTHGSVHS
jgi:hypothetical protein